MTLRCAMMMAVFVLGLTSATQAGQEVGSGSSAQNSGRSVGQQGSGATRGTSVDSRTKAEADQKNRHDNPNNQATLDSSRQGWDGTPYQKSGDYGKRSGGCNGGCGLGRPK